MSKLKTYLSELLREKGWGAKGKLAKHLGISPVYITRYVSKEYPNLDMPPKYFEKTAEFFNIDNLVLYSLDERRNDVAKIIENTNKFLKETFNDKSVNIPIIEALAGCGSAGMLEQLRMSDDKMSIDERLLPSDIVTDKLSMIRIVGDSMMPYLNENDWAIIQMRNGYEVAPVNGVYLITHGENVHIKRCAFQADGSCMLISDNQLYPLETAYAGDWDIVGKVVARLKFGSPMLIKE